MGNMNIYQEMSIPKDECYTTSAEADKIVDFLMAENIINPKTKIWLPFDTKLSRIYLSLIKHNHKNIILSSLETGHNFYHFNPPEYDLIFSNPPFSNRTRLFNRLFMLNKPFVILQASQMFNNQNAVNYICEKENISFIMPRSRMNFLTYNKELDIVKSSKNGNAFYSFWLTYKCFAGRPFISLLDNGREKEIEQMDINGNPIEDNYLNIFNIMDKNDE
jgi:hypothetical protein